MTSITRTAVFFCIASLFAGVVFAQDTISVGANVNMVTGQSFPNGDPFQRQQNEPSVAYSSRNSLHLLSGANDYRAVDVPGLPGGRETGDSWLSYFWSTNGGATWKSTLIPGYPQDPACQSANPPVLCDYAAGADPVVRAGVNGMFYYSGIVFERSDPSRSAIFVSRFIDLNNDEGGDPIRYIDTQIIDANNDGTEFLDKSWIGVDIPRGTETRLFTVTQRDATVVDQTVACGNIYVGYAAISGEGATMRSEIRMATSADCGDTWTTQPISEPDTLNQGANIAIHPLNGDVHVVWRRFDTVESFLGISPTGCPASPASWEVNNDWPVSEITFGGVTYTIAQAQELLGTKHRGDESIKLAYEVIAAKLNLLTGGGDPVDGFNPWLWAQDLNALIADAEAWFADNPVGSNPKQAAKKAGQNIKKNIQEILQGSGSCADGGTAVSTTGDTNAIMVVSSDDLGQTFSTPKIVDESSTFDQGSTRFSFRTTAYPTVAADADGRIYVAWAARGYATIRGAVSDGDARVVISTSTDGNVWSNPYAIDEPNREGHQIKPSLLFAGGQLTLVFYDFRQDVSNIFEGFVIDLPDGERLRHTVDVRVATALPDLAPIFTDYSLISGSPANPSSSASRYTFVAYGDASQGETLQVEYMVPNLPMFADGTTPFIGDYVDVAAPNLINDNGTWRFASQPGDVQVWQAVWSDNRDVIPPPDGDWSKYVAPIAVSQPSIFDPTVIIPSCFDVTFPASDYPQGSFYTGTRNQNVYSASISNGLIVAAPGNNRPLDEIDFAGAPLERGFVVYVQNTTGQPRSFRLSLPSIPTGIKASFAPNEVTTTKDIEVPPYSGAVATVFASIIGAPATEAIPVSVVELGGTLTGSVLLNSDAGAPDPLTSSLQTEEVHNPAILNPAILNPAILNGSVSATDAMICTDDPAKCVLNPAIFNPAVFNPAVMNPAIFNPAVMNPAIFNPAILNPAVFNPAVMNPAVMNPAVMNPAILNPAILNPAIFNPAIFNPAVLNPAVLNPAIMNPAILNPAILNPAVLNPAILNPAVLNPAIMNPAILNTTPGTAPEQVDVTFAIRNDGNATTAYDLNLAAPQLAGLDYELMVYRLNEIPVTNGCTLTSSAQQQLVFNQRDPLNNAVDGSFYLEPGQEVLVTFRVLPDVDADTPANPVTTFVSDDLSALVTAQSVNTDPATQPPADQFGPSAIVVLGTAGGTVIGAGGTAPISAGPLTAGEQVSVTATGFVRIGPSPTFALTTPDGNGVPCNAACLLPGAPASSLVARIGTGPWQLVGTGPTILTATVAGDLEFGINDNGYNDNTGAFYVTVSPYAAATAVSLWRADGDALDSVGGNDGTLVNGAGFALGVNGQAFSLNGAAQHVLVPDDPSLQITGQLTMSAWIYPTGAGSNPSEGGIIINKEWAYEVARFADGTIRWATGNGVNSFDPLAAWVNSGVVAPLNEWTHVAVTYNQGVGKTYINGSEVHTFDIGVDNLGAGVRPLRFGGREYHSQYFNGLIDEVGIYAAALTPAQVLDLHNSTAPFTLYTNETAFLNASGATAQVVFPSASQEGTLSTVCNQNPAPDYVENNFTLRHACGFGYLTGEFTANLDGGEFIVDGAEQVDISMPMDFRSFGIRIEDGFSGAGGAGCPAHDSSFTLAFKDGNTLVGQILIDPPTNQGSFIGVTSTVPFNNVEIREVGAPLDSFTGAFCEDDFFGTIFATPAVPFTQTVITGDSDILNDGILLVANDLGASPSAVTVNGVTFGTDQGGLDGLTNNGGGGDFSTDPFSASLDAILSDLKFTWLFTPVSLTINGLTPGKNYRLQLLFSNDHNSTGDNVEVTVAGETWIFSGWQPNAINLTARFTATGSSVVTSFVPGVGSNSQSGRAVLNAYVLHEMP